MRHLLIKNSFIQCFFALLYFVVCGIGFVLFNEDCTLMCFHFLSSNNKMHCGNGMSLQDIKDKFT